MLKIGIKNKEELTVSAEHTAKIVQSGGLDVLATPMLIALMEKCAWKSVLNNLEKGTDTVGTFIEVKHFSPTPIGEHVWCQSELISIDNRELTFKIEAFDTHGSIGEALHKRFIVNPERLQEKANQKLK